MAAEIILQPVKLTSTGTRYQAALASGEVLVASARCPECDACRELLARGIRLSAGVEHALEFVA